MKNFPSSSSLKNDDFSFGPNESPGKVLTVFFYCIERWRSSIWPKRTCQRNYQVKGQQNLRGRKKEEEPCLVLSSFLTKKMGPIWQMLGGPDEGMPIDIPRCFKFGPEYAQHQNNFWIYRCQPIYYLFSPLTYLIKYKWP